jgi:sulfoxide reductase catalytic subunit YedY
LPDSAVTPEANYLRRREFLRVFGLGLAASALLPQGIWAASTGFPDSINPAFKLDGVKLTPEDSITSYNNFYEWGFAKEQPKELANRGWKTEPWSLEIGGLCANPAKINVGELTKLAGGIERRNYRHRCVEAWSMVIPWAGFQLSELIKRCEPTSKAKYMEFYTLYDPNQMPGVRVPVLRWPYIEGLRMDEAMHPLALMVVGLYGKVLPNQNGAPLRIHLPWKYGFKSGKSIVHIKFTDKQPKNTWAVATPSEYGFYANVNPNVPHPRWSQAREQRLPAFTRSTPTQMFNGYDQVASLYAGMDLKVNF